MIDFQCYEDAQDLENADRILRIWGLASKEKPRRLVSSTWIVMRWIEDHSKRVEKRKKKAQGIDVKEEYSPPREYISAHEISLICFGVEKCFENKEVWHHYDFQKKFLVCNYYRYSNLYVGRFCRKLSIPRWKYKELLVDSLRRFYQYY